MRRGRFLPTLLLALLVSLAPSGCGHDQGAGDFPAREDPFRVLPFAPTLAGRPITDAVCYGPHRDGQRPGGPGPTADQLREDLALMVPFWNLLRVYGAGGHSETMLRVIREDAMPMRVVLGVWIAPEDDAANLAEVEKGVRLANEYRDIVVAVAVGNETQIEWSAHRSSEQKLVEYVRMVRAGVHQPVTVADDFNFWNKPKSRLVAGEIDFLLMHAHPMWNGVQLEDALPWLRSQLSAVRAMHPGRTVVVGETGWATSVHTEGEQAALIKGAAGEAEQKAFFDAARAWADSTGETVFLFEAFDENWKGGDHPAEVEKHWGFHHADRTPKAALRPPGEPLENPTDSPAERINDQ